MDLVLTATVRSDNQVDLPSAYVSYTSSEAGLIVSTLCLVKAVFLFHMVTLQCYVMDTVASSTVSTAVQE